MDGTKIVEPLPGVALACISPEARDLLDRIMADWAAFLGDVQKHTPKYEPTPYMMAYWLTRYSGLIEPAGEAETLRAELQQAREDAERLAKAGDELMTGLVFSHYRREVNNWQAALAAHNALKPPVEG